MPDLRGFLSRGLFVVNGEIVLSKLRQYIEDSCTNAELNHDSENMETIFGFLISDVPFSAIEESLVSSARYLAADGLAYYVY